VRDVFRSTPWPLWEYRMSIKSNLTLAETAGRRPNGRATVTIHVRGNDAVHITAAIVAYWFRELRFMRNSLATQLGLVAPHRAAMRRTFQGICLVLALGLGTEACTLVFLPPLSLSDTSDGGVGVGPIATGGDAGGSVAVLDGGNVVATSDGGSATNLPQLPLDPTDPNINPDWAFAKILRDGGQLMNDGNGFTVTKNGSLSTLSHYRSGVVISSTVSDNGEEISSWVIDSSTGQFAETHEQVISGVTRTDVYMLDPNHTGVMTERIITIKSTQTNEGRTTRESLMSGSWVLTDTTNQMYQDDTAQQHCGNSCPSPRPAVDPDVFPFAVHAAGTGHIPAGATWPPPVFSAVIGQHFTMAVAPTVLPSTACGSCAFPSQCDMVTGKCSVGGACTLEAQRLIITGLLQAFADSAGCMSVLDEDSWGVKFRKFLDENKLRIECVYDPALTFSARTIDDVSLSDGWSGT
jgi:hypothetical protein